MLESAHPPLVYRMSLVPYNHGRALQFSFSLRAWALVGHAFEQEIAELGELFVRNDLGVRLCVPIVSMSSVWWPRSRDALRALMLIVDRLGLLDFAPLGPKLESQRFWIDRMAFGAGNCGLTLVATPKGALDVLQVTERARARVNALMVAVEEAMFGAPLRTVHAPRVEFPRGALHLTLDYECASLGVEAQNRPTAYGWVAHSHNLSHAGHVLLALVAVAAIEDEIRALTCN